MAEKFISSKNIPRLWAGLPSWGSPSSFPRSRGVGKMPPEMTAGVCFAGWKLRFGGQGSEGGWQGLLAVAHASWRAYTVIMHICHMRLRKPVHPLLSILISQGSLTTVFDCQLATSPYVASRAGRCQYPGSNTHGLNIMSTAGLIIVGEIITSVSMVSEFSLLPQSRFWRPCQCVCSSDD